MPIFEYRCKKCGKYLEILHAAAQVPTRCEDDCVADGEPGDGELERILSMPAALTGSRDMALGKVDPDAAAKKGFTTFKRRGKGEYERVAGNAGPTHIVNKD